MNCAPTFVIKPLQKSWLASALIFAAGMANAAPTVEGIDLVSSTRVDRTKFDYTYTLRVRGDTNNYDSGTFIAKISSPGSTLLKNTVAASRLDAGSFYRTTDYITIRQDRQFPFDRTKLAFTFSGFVSESSNPGNGPTISEVNFYEWAGRPGHESASPLAIENPVAGSTLTLGTSILGNVNSANFTVRNEAGSVLQTDVLTKPFAALPTYASTIVVPTANFTIEIAATGTDGKTNKWRSKVFTPQTFYARIAVDSAVFAYGQVISAKIVGTSTTASGNYTISLVRPSDFPGSLGPWTVTALPGTSFEIPIQLQAPASGVSSSYYTLTLTYAPLTTPQNAQSSNQRFFAR